MLPLPKGLVPCHSCAHVRHSPVARLLRSPPGGGRGCPLDYYTLTVMSEVIVQLDPVTVIQLNLVPVACPGGELHWAIACKRAVTVPEDLSLSPDHAAT